ncbi:hypothetical protein CCACVL1_07495 [Corchorus capsularis]|uniref:Uncharacterized protein n=1 Tax=Corchorus capsularis TaxID=210143 RepID=A0A1R3J5Y6_COCAP|nr:hypothetical protein CCACVL1_07495 [Corchorus capsularis]
MSLKLEDYTDIYSVFQAFRVRSIPVLFVPYSTSTTSVDYNKFLQWSFNKGVTIQLTKVIFKILAREEMEDCTYATLDNYELDIHADYDNETGEPNHHWVDEVVEVQLVPLMRVLAT